MNILTQAQTLLGNLEPHTIALLCVLFIGPIVFLQLVSSFFGFSAGSMILEYIGLGWLWGDGESRSERRSSGRKSKSIRRRADLAQEGSVVSKGCYPGLVNISGTYCFFNSTVQAFASLKTLQPQINEIHKNAEDWDVPTPVLDALRSILIDLNTPHRRPSSFRPSEVIKALSDSDSGKRSALFASREHQDAQELFQLLSSVVRDEAANVLQEKMKERGLGGLATEASDTDTDIHSRSVFDGLMAQRRSCVECGYTEAVRHFAFDNVSLSVPPLSATSLYQCLQDYTRLEILEDCLCSNCSMMATHKRLLAEMERQQAPSEVNTTMPGDKEKPKTTSKRKRERDTRKYEELVRKALADRKVEEEIKGLKMEKVYSKRSTKQVMIARPPPVLALHLQRSAFFGRAVKNPCRVSFPEYLDVTSFTTSGQLSTAPTLPISQPSTPVATPIDSTHFHFPTAATNGIHIGPNSQLFPPKNPTSPTASNTSYRLAAIVCHYGAHSYGHYVTFRRVPGDRWMRASDSDVIEVSLRDVLSETMGTFMLYYERLDEEKIEPEPEEKTVEPKAPVGLGSTHTSVVLPAGSDVHHILRVSRPSLRPRVLRSVSLMSTSRASSIAPSVVSALEEVEEGLMGRPDSPLPIRPRTPSRSSARTQKSPPTSPPRTRRVHSPRPFGRSSLPAAVSPS